MDNDTYTGNEMLIAVLGALLGSPVSLAVDMLTGEIWTAALLGFFGLLLLGSVVMRPGKR